MSSTTAPALNKPLTQTEHAAALQAQLFHAGLIGKDTTWAPLGGGRSNHAWLVTDEIAQVVCKLYAADRQTPLFPNSARDEVAALHALDGSGLAPRPRGTFPSRHGEVVLYDYAPGKPLEAPTPELAQTLSRLHARCAPPGLRPLPGGSDQIAQQVQLLLPALGADDRARLYGLRPGGEVAASRTQCFLHGDPVAANGVMTAQGLVMIDWQCPAEGDPCEDLAIALSPAMGALYGGCTPDTEQAKGFLAAYDHPDRTARYHALAPHYHWRMAAYCLWMQAQGHADYGPAAALELAALDQL